MKIGFGTGDRVAWSEAGRGIIVAAAPGTKPHCVIAVWGASGFSGHLTALPPGLLYATKRIAAPPAGSRAGVAGDR